METIDTADIPMTSSELVSRENEDSEVQPDRGGPTSRRCPRSARKEEGARRYVCDSAQSPLTNAQKLREGAKIWRFEVAEPGGEGSETE